MIAAGRRSKTSVIAACSASSSTTPVPNVSTNRPTGSALPMAYATWTSHLVARPGGDDVLGDPAHRVGGGAVDLGRVLAGEGAAAVAGVAAVGVDDDLAAGEAGVAHRAADDELAGRVDEQPVALGLEAEVGDLRRDDVLGDVGGEQADDVDVLGVLRGHDDGVEARRACRRRTRWSPGSCRRGAGRARRRPCGPASAAGPGGAPARSAAA